jgi:predicted small secreted protein
MEFEKLKADNNIKEIIKSAFDAELDIDGNWGYTQEEATILKQINVSILQAEHTLISMRSYIEMNMTLPKEDRYGSINVVEKSREKVELDNKIYDKVLYSVSAMKENIYASFINEYKANYGKNDFDMGEHFDKRKEATIKREILYWFEITQVKEI